MRRLRLVLLVAFAVVCATCQTSYAQSGFENGEITVTWKGTTLMHVTGLPKASDYPSEQKNLEKRAADIDFTSNKATRSFRTRLRKGLTEEPNLAGKYRIVGIGCGTSCMQNWIINLENGDIFDGFPSSFGVWSSSDSHLIVMNPPSDNPEYMVSGTFGITKYYLFQDEKLTLLREINYYDYYTPDDLCKLSKEDFYCDPY